MAFINLLKHRLSHFKIKKIISGKTKGSISIYLSIVMVAVMLFISVVSESGRINVVYSESKSFTYMAADSVMAGYARQVFDEYGLLLVWENQNTEEELKKYIQANINMADLNGMGTNFMSTRLKNIEMDKVEYVTDNGEKLLLSQIASYTKYAAGATAAEELIKLFNKYEKRSDEKTDSVADVFDEKISENDSKELQNLVKDIDELIVKIKDVEKEKKLINAVSRIIERNVSSKNNDKVEKKYRSLRKILDKKAGMISRAIDHGKDYEEKKAAYLRESGYTAAGLFQCHVQLHSVQAVGLQILGQAGLHGHLVLIAAQGIDNDLLHFLESHGSILLYVHCLFLIIYLKFMRYRTRPL